MRVHHDLAEFRQLYSALEPFGVGHQANLYKHAFQSHGVLHTGGAVFVFQAIDLAISASDFGGLRVGVDGDVRQAFELIDQHGVGLELVCKLNHGHVADDAR